MRLLILALLFALPAQAGPLSWAKRQFQEHPVRTRIVTSIPVHFALSRGVSSCAADGRQENCLCKYGARQACVGAIIGLDTVGQLVGYKIGGKTGDAISYGGTAGELAFAVYQFRGGLNKPKENWNETRQSKSDLSRIVLVRR